MSLFAFLAAVTTPFAPCALPPGWETVSARPTRYIVLGETHGTEQAPAFVGQLVCALASRQRPLLLAVEQQATDNDAFQRVWSGPDQDFADRLRAAPGWKGRQDGVGSEAMFAMLVRLHRLRASGRRIDVVLFNGARDPAQRARFADLPGQGGHEAAQAENIRLAALAKRYDQVVILTGSLHARKVLIERRGLAFRPMAMQLAPASEITSLRLLTGAGTAWHCQLKPDARVAQGAPIPNDAIECGSFAMRAMTALSGPQFAKLGMPDGWLEAGYDGHVWLGASTGSAPAVP